MAATKAEPPVASEGKDSAPMETVDPAGEIETMESLKARNSELEEELNAAKLDAKETLLALLQMAEGVRIITKQMQRATYNNTDEDADDDADDESKTEELTEQLFSDSIVKETCLRGTVFGTDLLRLWDAAHHVRDYARMVSEESKVSVDDVIQAQTSARESLERAEKAEALVRDLQAQNVALGRQLDKTGSERRVLLKEVKCLRQHMAASRKTEMERLLQQHIAGALLLHEGQLKAMVAQQQQLKHAEEEKKDEEELELVQAEDCREDGQTVADDKSKEKPAAVADKSGEVAEELGSDKPQSQPIADENGQHVAVPVDTATSTADAPLESSEQTSVATDKKLPEAAASVSVEADVPLESHSDLQATPKPNASVGFNGGGTLLGFSSKFHASWTRVKPEATPQKTSGADKDGRDNGGEVEAKESVAACPRSQHSEAAKAAQLSKPDTINKENKRVALNQEDQQSSTSAEEKIKAPESSGTMTSHSYSPVKLFPSFSRASPVPPPQVQRQEQKPESSRSVGSASSTESSSGPGVGTKVINFLFYPEKIPHHQQAQPKPAVECPPPKKYNALLQLETSEKDLEKDSTSLDDTEPSTMATTSSLAISRARTFSGANSNTINENSKPAPSPMRIIPGSVSWSEDAQSIESNLASPVLQQSPKTIPGTDAEHVELYKDLKVFRSLAIPTDDEIDDYHYYQHHYQQESPQTTS